MRSPMIVVVIIFVIEAKIVFVQYDQAPNRFHGTTLEIKIK